MKPSAPLNYNSRQELDCRQLHANISKLPVYQFERLAFTDIANVPPVNEILGAKIPRSLFEKAHCFWRALF